MLSSEGSLVSIVNGRAARASLDFLSRISFKTSAVVTILSLKRIKFKSPSPLMMAFASMTAILGFVSLSSIIGAGATAGAFAIAAQDISYDVL